MKLTSSYNSHDLITWACTGLNYGVTKINVFLDMKAYLQNWVKHKFKHEEAQESGIFII